MSTSSTSYISASTNRFSLAADVSSESLIAFGSSKFVALWNANDESDGGVYETIPDHEAIVTCVRFVAKDRLVSADDKGVLRYWRREDFKWNTIYSVQAHEKAISALAICGQCLVTGASDSLVKVWEIETERVKEMQNITLRGRYALSFAVSALPNSRAIILAIGSTGKDIQIWTRSEDQFVFSAALSGHEDWIRSLSFQPQWSGNSPLLLASGSQDASIRLWSIEPFSSGDTSTQSTEEPHDDLLDAFEASLGELAEAEEGGRQISLKRHILTVKSGETTSQQFSITFDALLVGHEAGVTSLSWRPSCGHKDAATLLSTSTDSSLILWTPSTIITSSEDSSSSLWINYQRFGDIGGQRLGGFVGGVWAANGMEALAWGWNGGWRRWRCSIVDASEDEDWTEVGAITGHNAAVKSLGWSPGGEYLISASLDQTTRIHGAIPIQSNDVTKRVWHEIARPQVHGYDMMGVAFLDALRFVSIADEKVARVFEAPREFVSTVKNLGISDLASYTLERPRAATVPPLGLSNKAINEGQSEVAIDTIRTNRPPFEGELAAVTLWPEVEKVFGHGYESITLAVSSTQRLAATACKATSPEHAVIRVYDTEKWRPVGQPLGGHSLTVTRIAFSPDDRFILSVSRDRSWWLFERVANSDGYIPVAAEKSHARIIWDCAWAQEGDVFATASRDKTVKIWQRNAHENATKWTAVATLKMKEAATAVAFAPEDLDHRRRLAVGLESGSILVYSISTHQPSDWHLDTNVDHVLAHTDAIHQLAWNPAKLGATKQLASCSEDGTLRVLTINNSTQSSL